MFVADYVWEDPWIWIVFAFRARVSHDNHSWYRSYGRVCGCAIGVPVFVEWKQNVGCAVQNEILSACLIFWGSLQKDNKRTLTLHSSLFPINLTAEKTSADSFLFLLLPSPQTSPPAASFFARPVTSVWTIRWCATCTEMRYACQLHTKCTCWEHDYLTCFPL